MGVENAQDSGTTHLHLANIGMEGHGSEVRKGIFESKSHSYNSNQQIFQGDRIRESLFCNHKELYHSFINTNLHL